MKVAIGSDHAGLRAKRQAAKTLEELGHEVVDVGTDSEASTDYPDYALRVARKVASSECDAGILCCGTGIGMSMAANKVPGIRAAVCHNEYTCEMARRHNDANILCMGGRVLDERRVDELVRLFLRTPFEGGRHLRRVRKVNDLDRVV
ncbi:MAG: ribose 5-phosphate isomerase B [Candidatus Brocadiia bacterium]